MDGSRHRTARGSERDKGSTKQLVAKPAAIVRVNEPDALKPTTPPFSDLTRLNLYPARYRERFCTKRNLIVTLTSLNFDSITVTTLIFSAILC
jgi:hypothetical protein